jgi:hypothetical protein
MTPEITLEELLAGVTDENRHGELDTGPFVTREDLVRQRDFVPHRGDA